MFVVVMVFSTGFQLRLDGPNPTCGQSVETVREAWAAVESRCELNVIQWVPGCSLLGTGRFTLTAPDALLVVRAISVVSK
jgi:hypothetical protein